MKTITFITVLALAALTGCGTAQQNTQDTSLSERLAKLESNDKAQKQYIASLEAKVASKGTPVASAPQASVPTTGAVSSLVLPQPAAYQCFVGEGNPGFGGGNWVKIRNRNPKYDLAMTLNGKWNQGGTKIIVMVPRPGASINPMRPNMAQWMPYMTDRPGGVTALPAMSSCHLWTPERLDNDDALKLFSLFATAYQPVFLPENNAAVRHWNKAAVLKNPMEFTLNGQMETQVYLEWFNFI